MYHLLKTSVSVLLLFIVLACSKQSSTFVPPDQIIAYSVKAKVNGVDFSYEANLLETQTQSVSYSQLANTFSFKVTNKEKVELWLTAEGMLTKKPQTMDISIGRYENTSGRFYADNSSERLLTNGKCTITKIDDQYVEGTFYFDAALTYSGSGPYVAKVNVREGQFRLKY